jgi:N-methylhydantoinase B
MGIFLQNTAASVNIKERLDFSCAIFDASALLVPNAPHIAVHLGSMSESTSSLINAQGDNIKPGRVYLSNNTYNGGTHLADVTAITPVFLESSENIPLPFFFVASPGHQGDIGGITPGSMPPHSITVEEEGILFDNFLLVGHGKSQEAAVREFLLSHPYPSRNPEKNIADYKAKIAANDKGVKKLVKMVNQSQLETVNLYMQFIQDNAEESVIRAINILKDGSFIYQMDSAARVHVAVTIERDSRRAKIHFPGTSAQLNSNFNGPKAVTQAAVMYFGL